jgi:hypothetical protein
MDPRAGILLAYSGHESVDAGLPAIASRQFCTRAAWPRALGNYGRPIRHFRSCRLSRTGPSAGGRTVRSGTGPGSEPLARYSGWALSQNRRHSRCSQRSVPSSSYSGSPWALHWAQIRGAPWSKPCLDPFPSFRSVETRMAVGQLATFRRVERYFVDALRTGDLCRFDGHFDASTL